MLARDSDRYTSITYTSKYFPNPACGTVNHSVLVGLADQGGEMNTRATAMMRFTRCGRG